MRRVWVGAALAVLVVLAVAAVVLTSENHVSEFVGNSMLADIKVIGEPKVGNIFTLNTTLYLKYKYMGLFDVSNGTIIFLVIPDGVEVVSGDVNWTGDVVAFSNKTLQTSLKILREGEYTIHAYARGPTIPALNGNIDAGSRDGFHTQIYIESYNYSYIILPWKPIPTSAMGTTMQINDTGVNESM